MSSLLSAGLLLTINLGLLWLFMAAPLGRRTISVRRHLPIQADRLWRAVDPRGEEAGWSPSIVTSEPVEATGRVRQALAYPDRRGQPIVRLLQVDDIDSASGAYAFHARVVEDSALDRSYWSHFEEVRKLQPEGDGALLEVSQTDRYRGAAMYLFRYFALRREMNQLDQWVKTGTARPGGIFEHPLTQIATASLSTLLLWPFFGLTGIGLMISCLLTLVIVLHEAGHIVAYRAFGHRSARMIFIPLLGGIAIGGRPYNSLFEVATCALMGPGISALFVPVSIGLYDLALAESVPLWLAQPAIIFLLILGAFNLLNLLPMYRFDGGQVIRQIFPSRGLQVAASFGITAIILGTGWHIGVPLAGLQAAIAVFTLMSLMSAGRVKPREALEPMSSGERLMAGFGLYAAVSMHAYAIIYSTEILFN